MATVKLRNTNPIGAVELPLIGRNLEAGEEFEVDSKLAGKAPTYDDEGQVTDLGEGLLAQVGNYELVETPTKSKRS